MFCFNLDHDEPLDGEPSSAAPEHELYTVFSKHHGMLRSYSVSIDVPTFILGNWSRFLTYVCYSLEAIGSYLTVSTGSHSLSPNLDIFMVVHDLPSGVFLFSSFFLLEILLIRLQL